MDYDDFVLQLSTDSETPGVRVARSPAGESEPEPLILSLSESEIVRLAVGFGRAAAATRQNRNLSIAEVSESSIEEIGSRLFRALFPDTVRNRFHKSLGRAAERGQGLRIRIEVGLGNVRLARLHSVPWEYLAADGHFLALSREISIVRHLSLGFPADRSPAPAPLSILVLAGEALVGSELDLETERLDLESSWSEQGEVRIRLLPDCTLDALREELLAQEYHALHFMGHGEFSTTTGEGTLAFRAQDGNRVWVSGTELAHQLRDRTSLRLVFLNACESANLSTAAPYGGVATALLNAGIPAVIAMQFPISDAAALALSRTFYRRIARGDTIDAAMAEGRIAIRRLARETPEWGTPVLFERLTKGHIVQPAQPLRSLPAHLDLDAYREHQLSQLAIWERQYTRLDVDPAVALAGQDLRSVPNSRLPLTEAFIQQKRLIVLGGAGAGKTTSLLYLMSSVLSGGPLAGSLAGFVPVYIELGRFRAEASTLLDNLLILIADALFQGRACPKRPSLDEVLRLLESHRFSFLLDGLNEAQAGRAPCLMAIDDLAKRYPNHRIVVSSRPHGFSPPHGWSVVLLRELEDAQISEFVARYSQDEASQPLLQAVLAAHNPLLRVPLFLNLALRMSGRLLPDLRRLRSRSGLVAQYVDSLLQWNSAKGNSSSVDTLSQEDRLRGALDRLARASQTSGQILSLTEARSAVTDDQPNRDKEAPQTLAALCEWGILATDGQNIRFWHQTLQEYFYAGSVVRRWRGSRKKIGWMPWWLRRLAARPEEQEALSFMVAHLRDDEAAAALRHGLPVNPALAISWADDLSLEGRARPATELFPTRMRRFSFAAIKYSKFGKDHWSILYALVALGFFFGLIAGFLLWVALSALADLDKIKLSADSLLNCGWFLGFLPFLDALLRCPSVKKLESALLATLEIRDPPLRKTLGALAREISQSKIARREVRVLAQGISMTEVVNGEELIRLLRTSDSSYTTTRLIGHLDTPFAIPLFEELLKLNNFLSLAALEALIIRANRLRDERQKVKDLLWAVWEDHEMDILIRRRARKLLLRMGEHPGGQDDLRRYFMHRSLKGLAIGLGLVATAAVLWATAFFFGFQNPTMILLAFSAGMSAVTWWDARRIGARKIRGHPRFEAAPWNWAFGSFFLGYVQIPLYLLNRQRIRRDAAPVDWDAILQAIQAQEPHGDSLSIIHPPSPFR